MSFNYAQFALRYTMEFKHKLKYNMVGALHTLFPTFHHPNWPTGLVNGILLWILLMSSSPPIGFLPTLYVSPSLVVLEWKPGSTRVNTGSLLHKSKWEGQKIFDTTRAKGVNLCSSKSSIFLACLGPCLICCVSVQANTQVRHLGKSSTRQQSILQIALRAYLNCIIVKLNRWDIYKQLIWKRFRQRKQLSISFQRS